MELDRIEVKRALISVADKTGLIEFGRELQGLGVEIVSSDGTAAALADAGIAVTLVSDVTGAAELLGGRVKTLHPRLHGGILARITDPAHRRDLERENIEPFQLVVSNLYPFEDTVAAPGVSDAEVIEQIDIGGVALTRAAAKNHEFVGVVTDPGQYQSVIDEIRAGGLTSETRHDLAHAAFYRTASYDAAIVNWFETEADHLPTRMILSLERALELRYGENPHQAAALYRQRAEPGWWEFARLVQGKALSFNNLSDAEAAWRLVNEIDGPATVIVKHTNPCGVAIGADLVTSFRRAWECDPISAFGGVVACNRPLDEATAKAIGANFVEVVIAPEVKSTAGLKEAVRVLTAPAPHGRDLDLRRVEGGFLAQRRDLVGNEVGEAVTRRQPTAQEREDLKLAVTVAAHTKSNAVVIVRDRAAVGVGAGDQSRVGAVVKALRQAGGWARGAVAASDAFFPFPDGIEALAAGGVVAVAAPGGSRNDDLVTEAADRLGLALVRLPLRHFRH